MAISETTLKEPSSFWNRRAEQEGWRSRQELEAVVVDPASNWPLFRGKSP